MNIVFMLFKYELNSKYMEQVHGMKPGTVYEIWFSDRSFEFK